MTDEPRRVIVGLIPSGYDSTFVEGAADPVALLIGEAHAKLDAQRDAEARVLAAKAADIERAKNTRAARAKRRLRQALTLFARTK
jgi:hypothetical protein